LILDRERRPGERRLSGQGMKERMRTRTSGLMIFLFIASTLMSAQTTIKSGVGECNPNLLPPSIQEHLLGLTSEWKVQQLRDLGSRAQERWESEKPLACPGIAIGRFDGSKELSYTVLLVPIKQKAKGYKLIGFKPQPNVQVYQETDIDQSDQEDASGFFIRSIDIQKFFDPRSRKKFQMQAQKGILFIDAGDQEYEADIYFWAEGKYHRQPIDY
jgi:hypothetical protein